MASGYFERCEKRSPYERMQNEPQQPQQHTNGFRGFMTLLLLCILWPIGLILLCSRKVYWNAGAKVMLAVLTLVVFYEAFAYASGVPTGIPMVEKAQGYMQTAVSWTEQQSRKAYASGKEWVTVKTDEGTQKAETIWREIRPAVAGKTARLLGNPAENADYLLRQAPRLAAGKYLEDYKRLVNYHPADDSAAETETDGPAEDNIFENVPEWIEPSNADTELVLGSDMPEVPDELMLITEPALDPKPAIRRAEDAEVYYTKRGKYYHLDSTCKDMYNADSHTLAEAVAAKKKTCPNCKVIGTELLSHDTTDYLWVDYHNMAHTTDLCIDFDRHSGYSILTNDVLYNGSYTYCSRCRADLCYEYMRREYSGLTMDYSSMDTDTLQLYEYERLVSVYYRSGETFYHANAECQMMTAEEEHNLYEALYAAKLKPCPACSPATEGDCREKIARKMDQLK